MNASTRKASGTKASQLSNAVPGLDAANASQSGIDAELEALSEDMSVEDLEAQFLASAAAQEPTPSGDPEYPIDPRAQPQMDLTDPRVTAANLVEQGLPMAVSTIGTVGGAMAGGSATMGLGVAAGAEAGNAAAAAVNVALAPQYKKVADSIREHFGIPVEEKDELSSRVEMAIGEAIGLVIPRFLQQRAAAKDVTGKVLASSKDAAKTVAKNIATIEAAKDQGIDLGARGFAKDTALEGGVQQELKSQMAGGLGAQGMVDAQAKNLDEVTSAFKGLKDAVGTTVNNSGEQIISNQTISARKEILGKRIGKIREIAIEEAGDKTFPADPLIDSMKRALEQRGLKTSDGKLSADAINSLAPEAREIAAQYNSLLNKVKQATQASGKNEISLTQVQEVTKTFQDLAEFEGLNRGMTQKQFGSMAHEAKQIRDQYFRSALDEAAERAANNGNTVAAENIRGAASRLEMLNERYGAHAVAENDFYKAVNKNPQLATENLIRKLGQDEWDNTMKVLRPREKEALGSAYMQNLIDSASKDGVILDPQKIRKTITADNAKNKRLEQLLGKENFDQLGTLVGYAETAEKIETKGAPANAMVKTLGQAYSAIRNAGTFSFLENLLHRTPKIKDLVEDTPGYIAAFKKYHSPMSSGARVAQSADLVAGQIGSKALPKALQFKNSSDKDSKNKELRGLELQFLEAK